MTKLVPPLERCVRDFAGASRATQPRLLHALRFRQATPDGAPRSVLTIDVIQEVERVCGVRLPELCINEVWDPSLLEEAESVTCQPL